MEFILNTSFVFRTAPLRWVNNSLEFSECVLARLFSSPLSLSRRLQTASLLAVLAGYGLLLAASHWLARLQRMESHRDQLALLQLQLSHGSSTEAELRKRLMGVVIPGIQFDAVTAADQSLPVFETESDNAGRFWLVSSLDVPLASQGSIRLLVREDITSSVKQEWIAQMLLVAMAGISTLLTSALLRPVLRRGLVEPLQSFSYQLDATSLPPSTPQFMDPLQQPEELRSIVDSFNQLSARLEESWRREREFVDGVSHELRTPITLIHGHAQRLQRHNLAADIQSDIQHIVSESQRMGSLVSVLLELARTDSGRLHIAAQLLDAEQELVLAYERLKPRCSGRLRLWDCLGVAAPLFIRGDSDRLQQCIAALVENALSYSPKGSPVFMFLSVEGGVAVLHVQDCGAGVPLYERGLIFERFFRGSAALSVRGSGIGLALVKQLMEAMGGTVGVHDAADGGADFQLRFPVTALDPQPLP